MKTTRWSGDHVHLVAQGAAKRRVTTGNEDNDPPLTPRRHRGPRRHLGHRVGRGDQHRRRADSEPAFCVRKEHGNKAGVELAKKKEPVTPKFDAAAAAPPATKRAAARAEHEARNALAGAVVARNIGVVPAPALLLHLDDKVLAGLQRER